MLLSRKNQVQRCTSMNMCSFFQLLDLGFEEERIVDALLKHNNDRDKALEELIA